MNLESEWVMAVLRVIQATNVVMIHSPVAPGCSSVHELKIDSLPTFLALSRESLETANDEWNASSDEDTKQLIDAANFIWSVLRMHDASFCPFFGCELCLRMARKTKWATCLALVRNQVKFPTRFTTLAEQGYGCVAIHDREVSINLAHSPAAYSSRQSLIMPNLLLTTFANRCRFDLDALHDVIV